MIFCRRGEKMTREIINIIPTISFTKDEEEYSRMLSNIIYSNAAIVRCNISRGSIKEYVDLINNVRNSYWKHTGKILKVLLDLPIPKDRAKIRINGDTDRLEIDEGDRIILLREGCLYDEDNAPMLFVDAKISHHKKGEIIIIGDGYLRLLVDEVKDSNVTCKALNSAYLTSDVRIASKSGMIVITENELVEKSVELTRIIQPECIALSHVENVEDINNIKRLMKSKAGYVPDIMSKIENTMAIKNTEEIRDASDSIMIARGCLAANVGAEYLLKAQDDIVDKCIETKEKIFIASNILKSLSSKVWPTRSDVCDAAHMIKSGIHNIIITEPICKEYNFKYLCDSLNELGVVYAS